MRKRNIGYRQKEKKEKDRKEGKGRKEEVSSETIQTRRQWKDIFKVLKEKLQT